jgi:hypothetical protein
MWFYYIEFPYTLNSDTNPSLSWSSYFRVCGHFSYPTVQPVCGAYSLSDFQILTALFVATSTNLAVCSRSLDHLEEPKDLVLLDGKQSACESSKSLWCCIHNFAPRAYPSSCPWKCRLRSVLHRRSVLQFEEAVNIRWQGASSAQGQNVNFCCLVTVLANEATMHLTVVK